jgi:hypothetical protein
VFLKKKNLLQGVLYGTTESGAEKVELTMHFQLSFSAVFLASHRLNTTIQYLHRQSLLKFAHAPKGDFVDGSRPGSLGQTGIEEFVRPSRESRSISSNPGSLM